jgi:hypothetical protein
MTGNNKKTIKPSPRLSLYGMKPEDALRKALSTPPPKPAKKAGKKKG